MSRNRSGIRKVADVLRAPVALAPDSEKPGPCPFDGEENVAVTADDADGRRVDFYFVQCGSCSARGPEADEQAEAVAAWNERVG